MSAYDDLVTSHSPLTWLKLDDATGTSVPFDGGSLAADLAPTWSGGEQLEQAPIVTDGVNSAAASADGTLGIASNDTPGPDGLSTAVTMTVWFVMPAADMSASVALWGEFDDVSSTSSTAWLVVIASDFSPGRDIYWVGGAADGGGPYAAALAAGTHMGAITNDGTTATLYIDGVSVDSRAVSWLGGKAENFSLGGSESGGSWSFVAPPECLVEEFAVFDACLSSGDIGDLYTAGSTGGALITSHGVGHCTITAETSAVHLRSDGVAHSAVVAVSAPGDIYTEESTVPVRVYVPDRPIVMDGKPVTPLSLALMTCQGKVIQGPSDIRAVPQPAPSVAIPPPPVRKPFAGRWVVDDLPSPGSGFYWLGDASPFDGTEGTPTTQHFWRPHSSTPSAPSWHSHYPFKPSVTAVDHYLQGGGVVHHPKGINFNAHFIEHMWLDFGSSKKQPFTWVIVGMVTSWPSSNYGHHVLDAGVAPSARGVTLSAAQCNTPRSFNDDLAYRNSLVVAPHLITGAANNTAADVVRASYTTRLIPMMWIMEFDGVNSFVGAYSTYLKRLGTKGSVANGSAQAHRNWVMGRQQGYLDQDRASHMLIFEMRYWDITLTAVELASQYEQLSSTYQFARYKNG